LGASALLQLVLAKFALEQQKLPPTLHAGHRLQTVSRAVTEIRGDEVLITSVGFNQQVNAALVRRWERVGETAKRLSQRDESTQPGFF
jgi:3-oxoacyl-(acyl-carrier-protein) synthase